jgi:hypothetical protein
MEEFGFPFTIQSDASLNMYPKNNASRFRVQLAQPLNFDERWVVGLAEIHFPLSFGQTPQTTVVPFDEEKSMFPQSVEYIATPVVRGKRKHDVTEQKSEASSKRSKRAAEPAKAYKIYESGGVVIKSMDVEPVDSESDEVQDLLKKHKKEYEQWKKDNLRLLEALDECETGKRQVVESCNGQLQKLMNEQIVMLQAKEKQVIHQKSTIQYWKDNFVSLAHLAYRDANQMNNSEIPKYLYIYCDIVQMRQVGDTYANFLHLARVPPIRINGDTAVDRFDFPRYNKLAKHNFDCIEVVIRNEFGDVVEFQEGGTVIITLHFKCVRC